MVSLLLNIFVQFLKTFFRSSDFDECDDASFCASSQQSVGCVNIPGFYTCSCADGYEHTSLVYGSGCQGAFFVLGGGGGGWGHILGDRQIIRTTHPRTQTVLIGEFFKQGCAKILGTK